MQKNIFNTPQGGTKESTPQLKGVLKKAPLNSRAQGTQEQKERLAYINQE